MWYPTLPDILEVHERIASFKGLEAEVRAPSSLDRVIVAPQRVQSEEQSPSNLARKAAALIVPIVRDRVFENCNDQTAFAVASVFLDRNGISFQTSLEEMEEVFFQIRDESLGAAQLATWIESRLSSRFDRRHTRRILTALNRLANVVEDLQGMPGMQHQVETLDSVGNVLCVEIVTLFSMDSEGKKHILQSYPALREQWGEVFEE